MAEQQGAGVVETPGSTSTQQPAAAAGTAAGTGNAAPTATPTGTPNPTPFSYKEDRSNWIPDHRFKEVSAQARRATELESQLNEERRRVAALAGVNTPTADSQKSEQIKAAFFEMFPQMKALANLTPEQIQQAFTTMPDAVNSAQQGEARYWSNHGKQQVTAISERVAEALNQDKLEPEQEADLRDSFTSWFKGRAEQELNASDGQTSKTLQRYEDGDGTLLDEFVSRYVKTWVEPARRVSTARVVNRTRPTPNSGGRAQVTTLQRPDKFKSMDERLDFAVGLAKERGVQFGR